MFSILPRAIRRDHSRRACLNGFALLACLFGVCTLVSRPGMAMSNSLTIKHVGQDFAVDDLDNAAWGHASETAVTRYWSGKIAPDGRRFEATLLWSDSALYVRFVARSGEPLVVSEKPDLNKKVIGLWDRDVCEIFIAPNKNERNKYFEFEIAPTGEWVDLGIEVTATKRLTDWDYASAMQSAAKIEKDKVVMVIKLEWKAFGKTPKAGDVWLGNLFRCVGKDPTRGYLAWQPTKTKEPSFHVPKAFGEFHFAA